MMPQPSATALPATRPNPRASLALATARAPRALTVFALAAGALLGAPAQATPWQRFGEPTPDRQPEAIGKFTNGCVLGAQALPDSGPGYQAVRLARKRNYGHPWLVETITELGARVAERGLGTMLVADMSMPRGGRFASGHRSHQSGLDADIWLRLDAPRLPKAKRMGYSDVAARLFVDRKALVVTEDFAWKHAELIRLAAQDDRVARIFVHPAIKKDLCERRWEVSRDWLEKVRPWWGHDAHFHLRLQCPPGSVDCADQAPPPPGEGCGEALDEWFVQMRKPPQPRPAPPPSPPPTPPLPERCQLLLDGAG